MALMAALQLPGPGVEAASAEPDGLTSKNAAPSCWAIKQAYPASPTGQYWLQTPTLVTAEKFYCDMTTDGGGWVLVARGREGWTFDHNGQGSPGTLRGTPIGTGAFAPAALPASTIDGLLDGGRPDALADGIRIRRARNQSGSQWQEVRWDLRALDRWSWGWPGGYLLDEIRIDGQRFSGGNTYDSKEKLPGQSGSGTGSDNEWLRLFTWPLKAHNYRGGFSYGTAVSGSSSSSSYLWEYGSENQAIAFSQVFIRPKITDPEWPAVPDDGLPAVSRPPTLSTTTSTATPWGVTGTNSTSDNITKAPTVALAQVGETMFVGGKFRNVQQGPSGSPHPQPWLAGFDVQTGEWRSDFRPELNGTVWDLVATPDGGLIAAGQFTQVNGESIAGVVKLDPQTGAIDDEWVVELENVTASGTTTAWAKALDVDGSWVYIGGDFTRVRGGSAANSVARYRLARVRIDTGTVDWRWQPSLAYWPHEIDVSEDGQRLYLVGGFNKVNGETANKVAVLSLTDGKLVPGLQPYQPSAPSGKQYQQTILDLGHAVAQGGAQHNLHFYDPQDYSLLQSHIMKKGGDLQALALVDGVLYAACHCADWNYAGATAWPNVADYTHVDQIHYIGAYDPVTFQQIPGFQPDLTSGLGAGAWDLVEDSLGCLWFAGDFNQGARLPTGGKQWLGGFGKLCAGDTTPPEPPSGLSRTWVDSRVRLQWIGSSEGGVTYEVLRNGRVVGISTTLSYLDQTPTVGDRYTVRAVDAAGNRSSSTPVATA